MTPVRLTERKHSVTYYYINYDDDEGNSTDYSIIPSPRDQAVPPLVEMLLDVHRNRRFIRDGSPGRPPRLSHSSWALLRLPQVDRFYIALFSSQASQQIGQFPTKRVGYQRRHPFLFLFLPHPHESSLKSQRIRGNVHRTGRIFPKHVERGF